MRSYKEITYRYLKGQRNRTLLTILGIILSVALVSAIGTIIVSARGALITEAIRENGAHHAIFMGIDRESTDKLINHVAVSDAGISKIEGAAIVKETTKEEREDYGWDIPYRYLEIEGYDKKSLEMLPFNIESGRVPETPEEIALEHWVIEYFDKEVKLGDKIKLNLGNRIFQKDENPEGEKVVTKESFEKTKEKEYTVVGFIKPQYIWKGNLVTTAIIGMSNEMEEGNYNAYIKIPNVKDANKKIMDIANDIGISEGNVQYNNKLLRLYAESLSDTFNKSMITLLAFIVGLIVVSTVAVIYNAFNISVLERISQFGLLRSVGATPKQIRGIVLKEASILSVIGIPIGLFSGVLAMKIVLYAIGLLKSDIPLFKDMEITISAAVFLISSVTGLITVFLSAIGPARRGGKVSPLEAVRNTGNFKKETYKKTRNSIFIRKILGVEGEIAYKNLKRNRKRFIITVFSMVISIVLIITFSSFSDFMFKMGVVTNEEMGDFTVYGNMDGKSEEIYNELKAMKDVNRIFKVKSTNGEALLEKNMISQKMMDMAPSHFNDKKDDLIKIPNIEIYTIGDENFDILKELLQQGTLDIEELNKNNGVLVINNTYAHKEKNNGRVFMEGYKLKPGDKIPFSSYKTNSKEDIIYSELTVAGVLEKGILERVYSYNGSINIITTETVFNNLFGTDEASPNTMLDSYNHLYIEMDQNSDIKEIRNYIDELSKTTSGLNYIDYQEYAKQMRTSSIVISIFLYGFVTIIALISCINIINTISTNIILRTKEIAMIKAVGMTQSGIKRMVAFESLYYGLYAAVFGGVIGTGLTYALFNIVIGIREFEWVMPWQNVIIACVGATVVALLSGAYPLKRINDKIIVESMKTEN